MRKRGTLGKGLVVIAFWVLGAAILILTLAQVRDYAGIINDSGVVRGGTQRVVKMELVGQSATSTEQRVTSLLEKLTANEEKRLYKGVETSQFMEDLAAVNAQWRLIENEIAALHRGEGSAQRLLELSETHFALADAMVLSAQKRAEHDLLATGAICTILFLSAATIMLFMRNDRISKLKKAYFTDPLTKHGNMLAFEEQGQQLLSDAAGGTYLVAYTNVSNFRYINETYGYESGDRLIVTLARLLDSACRRNELAAHDNADHFVLLLHNEPQRIERLLGHVEAELRSTPELHFTGVLALGCGVCEAENPGNSIPLLVSNAIAVMKEIPGKKGIARYDQSFRNALELKNRIERHADQALAMREFRLYLQPKNLLGDGTLAGAEALARWESPELGFLPPDTFIPLFEKNGFIVQLDFYMLKRVCQSYPMKVPGTGAALVVSVNFSRVTIMHESFIERLLRVVDSARIPHEVIEVEVTESAFVMDEEAVIGKLKKLKELGFRLAMDDFGTGYSSLNLLRKLPIDVLKIDRSFLAEGTDPLRSRSVLKGVLDMADDLGLVTVCEGVETEEQAAMLHDLGCPVGQGYVFSKPLPEEEFRARFGLRKPSLSR